MSSLTKSLIQPIVVTFIFAVLMFGASPVGGQAVCDPAIVGNCDEDGDCFIKNNKGCKKKNEFAGTDCDDSDASGNLDCDDGGDVQDTFTAAFTEGIFQFADGSVDFIVNTDDAREARSVTQVTLEPNPGLCQGPDDVAVPCIELWDEVFEVCSEVLLLPLDSIVVPAGRVDMQKSAGVIQMVFSRIEAEALDHTFVNLSVALQGMRDRDFALGSDGRPYVFNTFSVFTGRLKGSSGGGKKTCLQSGNELVPLSIVEVSATTVENPEP